ncbi:universal stress protein [Paraliomyxa miuraensis]|uniref:universal stress protein n=1 Tax=Paraliomyxa miuraensis TaxID=376150 RepID=UPI002255AC0E|nr:universal stress protein [Paraliomyxa miuraensis]MCX4247143.1 universal stress protein [Paraliomyxa miuraensis]
MRWLVGLDLTPHSVGLIRLARWLSARSGGALEFHALHADTRRALGLHGDGGELGSGPDLEPTLRQVRAFLEEHGVLEAFRSVDVGLGAPVELLPALARERGFDGLLLGRAAPRGRRPLVALGSVPRRLLRQPILPTAIVPPDLDPASLGRGPLLVGVNPSAYCLEAAALARRLARWLSLSVRMVHVVSHPAPVAAMGVLSVKPRDPTMATSDLMERLDASAAERAIERWVEDHGLGDLPLELRHGPISGSLRRAALDHEATMLMSGSRRLTLTERMLDSSVGSDLAAHADRPVVVVPAPLMSR